MTTIVYSYKDKTIATDGLMTCGNDIMQTDAVKMIEKDGKKWFFAGKAGEHDIFINDFEPLKSAKENLDVIAFRAEGKNVYLCSIDNGVYRECLLTCNDAIGSGAVWALAALDFECTAPDAVRYAAKKDAFSGGKVQTYVLEGG